MLDELETQNFIAVRYSDIAPVSEIVLDFPTDEAYEMISLRSTIIAQGAIVLPGMAVQDENGTFVTSLSIIPWQFAGTTVTTTTAQTPDVSLAGLFGPNIGSTIASGLHVFSGWRLLWADFLGTPGVSFDGVITFAQSDARENALS